MFMISSSTVAGKQFIDLHALPLPNGVLAHTLGRAELYRQLATIDVPGIDVHDGNQDLLTKYAAHLAAKDKKASR